MTGVTTADFKKFQLENKVNINCNVLLDAVQIVSVVASGCHVRILMCLNLAKDFNFKQIIIEGILY